MPSTKLFDGTVVNSSFATPTLPLRRRLVPAAFWAVALSAGFFIVYNGCNWAASKRANVGTWYYAWERYIPFIPAAIVPYMSIDLFFFFSPLLCQSRAELHAHAKRVALAIVAAGICFLLFPLKMGTIHKHVGGFDGLLFDFLGGFDRPYNLVPSLHIALLAILWSIYSRHTRGALKWLLQAWFVLIAASTLLTGQHHVVDLAGGFLLGWLCLYFVPDERRVTPGTNLRAARRYAIACGLLVALAGLTRPWGLLMLWPAASLAIMAVAYARLGPAVFAKSAGRVPRPRQALLAPCLGGNRLSAVYLRRRSDPWCQLAPGVWLGRRPGNAEAHELVRLGISAVLDVTAEYSERPALLSLNYKNLPVLDLTTPSVGDLEEGAAFIESHASRGVYVHCALGYSRSVCFAAAWLLKAGLAGSADHAIESIRKVRPAIVIGPTSLAVLREYQASRVERLVMQTLRGT
jgi:protein-tyrosine phosphatase/membrane-associated phospholipid phosphatase